LGNRKESREDQITEPEAEIRKKAKARNPIKKRNDRAFTADRLSRPPVGRGNRPPA